MRIKLQAVSCRCTALKGQVKNKNKHEHNDSDNQTIRKIHD